MNMRMDSLTEVDQELLSDIRHIKKGGYDDEYEEYGDDYSYDEKPRRYGHRSWE